MGLKEKVYTFLQENKRTEIHIPELGETAFSSPVTTVDMEKILTLSNRGQDSKDFHVWTIIEKLEDQEGRKIFGPEDKPFIEKLPWKMVIEISGKIQDLTEIAEVKKTSEKTTS